MHKLFLGRHIKALPLFKRVAETYMELLTEVTCLRCSCIKMAAVLHLWRWLHKRQLLFNIVSILCRSMDHTTLKSLFHTRWGLPWKIAKKESTNFREIVCHFYNWITVISRFFYKKMTDKFG